jgi:Kef-type K+ transport system membrane component KefB
LLLFSVGLETQIGKLLIVGKRALLVGLLGVLVPFVIGIAWAYYAGFKNPDTFFVASAFVATSTGITASVLRELGALDRVESQIILAAAVIDDILAMLLLAIVTSLQGDAGFSLRAIILIVAQAVGFVVLVALGGTAVMRRSSDFLDKPINPLSPLCLSLAGCLGLAVAGSYFGLAAIIGAFLAGIVLAESRQREALEHQMQPILTFLVPFFFVVTGTKVVLSELGTATVLLEVAAVTILAIFGKLVGCGLGAISLGKRSALIIGVGMSPRGEVGVIIASLGQLTGVFSPQMFAIIVAMSLLTSMISPPILGILLKRD